MQLFDNAKSCFSTDGVGTLCISFFFFGLPQPGSVFRARWRNLMAQFVPQRWDPTDG